MVASISHVHSLGFILPELASECETSKLTSLKKKKTFFSILYDYAQLLVELKYKHANIIYNLLTALLFFLLIMCIVFNCIDLNESGDK
uniref:Uncharacterized protein n=1 Tax=Timema poppense TaxID=170557 RepID=A0A7R9CYY6_TIMPO|nr:unnamed protein product [Timema poppensis]